MKGYVGRVWGRALVSETSEVLRIALLSRKGSVGKTTTAVNLAAAFAARELKTLLLDLDGQASASLSLGVRRSQLAPSMADVLLGRMPLPQAIRPSNVPKLDLVTGSVDLFNLDREMMGVRNAEQCLQRPLAAVSPEYQATLLDCPAGLHLATASALAATDAYMVTLSPQFLVLDGLKNFLEQLERMRFRLGSESRFLGILLTQVDYRTKTTKPYVDQIREEQGEWVFNTEVRVNVRLAEAPSFGQTIFQYDPDCSGARSYWELADEVLRRYKILRELVPRSAPRPQPPPESAPARRLPERPAVRSWVTLPPQTVHEKSEV